VVRAGLVPVTVGLVIAGGTIMARTADADWHAATVTVIAAVLMLRRWLNPSLILLAGGALGGLNLL
jgi:chromate transporter